VFWKVLDNPQLDLLTAISKQLPIAESYLAGGTALSLMLGHRKSIDLDWFTPLKFDPAQVEQSLASLGRVSVSETTKNTFHHNQAQSRGQVP